MKTQTNIMHADAPLLIEINKKERYDDYLYEPFVTTPEGYLKGRAVVTNIGIFPYYVDGQIENRLRLPEDVLDQESLDSLKMLPLTNNHPSVSVTLENIKDYQVGHLGTDIRHDKYSVSADIIITDKDTIAMVKDGKVALSCGYFSAIEDVSGTKWGQPYDSKQTHIRYNHVAIVEAGRAGDDARMFIDSNEPYFYGVSVENKTQKPQDDVDINNDTHTKEKKMLITIDSKVVDLSSDTAANDVLAIVSARDEALTANSALKQSNDALVSEKVALEASVDGLKEELKTEREAKKAIEDSIDSRIQAEVKDRAEVLKLAEKLEVAVESADSVLDMKKKIVLAKSSDKEAVALKMNDAVNGRIYVDARIDSITELAADASTNEQSNAATVLGSDASPAIKPLTADEARKKSDAEILNKKQK